MSAKQTRAEARRAQLPWVEKYRPKSVDEVAHQPEVVRMLKRSMDSSNLPHMLFYGPPGTGKTSTILAIAKQLYGPELYSKRVLELNASDERGIKVVRTKIKDFASTAVGTQTTAGYPCPPYKIIILDEADAMTRDAQTALRRTMEQYSTVTRFCILCNYISRIIPPLTSRCAKFRFQPLEAGSISARLGVIVAAESVACEAGGLEAVVKHCGGDMRKAIMMLQTAHQYHEKVDEPTIVEIAALVPDTVMASLVEAAHSQSFESLQREVASIVVEGFPANQVLLQLHDGMLTDSMLEDSGKAAVAEALAVADKCLSDGADDYLQLLNCASVYYGASTSKH